MATLEHFLRTGQLGPVVLGMTPADAVTALGPPQNMSKKSNPLLVKYGGLQLTFVRRGTPPESRLTQIGLYYQPEPEPMPPEVQPTDWPAGVTPTERDFRSFLHRIGYLPVHMVEAEVRRHLIMPSGVRVTFSEEKLHSLQLTQREAEEGPPPELTDEREPTVEQIRAMLAEAALVTQAGAHRAGLLLAWAGLEAVLRRKALRAGLQGRIGVQPLALIRELQATRNISPGDFQFLDQVRQVRTAAAHGLAPQPIGPELVQQVIQQADRLLHEVAA